MKINKILNSRQISKPLYGENKDNFSIKILEKTSNFLKRFSDLNTPEIENFLSSKTTNVHLRDPRTKLYLYDNLLLYRSNGKIINSLANNTEFIRNYGISPQVLDLYKLGNDDYIAILGISDCKLLHMNDVLYKIPQNTKSKFKDKLKKLVNNNFVNNEIFANNDAFFVTEDLKKILYADWGFLKYENTNKQPFFFSIENLF